MKYTMIPARYMAKKIQNKPEGAESKDTVDIYSVSDCISKDFVDHINFWKHNGYWFFDSPQIIQQFAKEHSVELTGTSLFYTKYITWSFMKITAGSPLTTSFIYNGH